MKLPWCQQAADELRGNHLGRASEEALGEVLGEVGGYGGGLGGDSTRQYELTVEQ